MVRVSTRSYLMSNMRKKLSLKIFIRLVILLVGIYLILYIGRYYEDYTPTEGDGYMAKKDSPHDWFLKPSLPGNQQHDFCSVFSPTGSGHLYPITRTNLSSWDFTQTVDCTKLKFTNEQPFRRKVNLDCSRQPKMTFTKAANTTDVYRVEFGDACLRDVIDRCCKDSQPVPNVVHYVWYAKKPLGYFHFLSYVSAMRFMAPCLFLIHGEHLPYGPYWDYFLSLNPNVIHVKRPLVTSVYGHRLVYTEHGSDVMRIEALRAYGGVYLDWDEVLLRPLEPLRRYEYTQGYSAPTMLGSQLIMAARNATFLTLWHQGYKDYITVWASNALFNPFKLAETHPHLIHIEGYNFTRPAPNQIDLIFKENYDWSTNYAMHLFIRYYKRSISLGSIRRLNTTIGAVSRHILLGNKELCSN